MTQNKASSDAFHFCTHVPEKTEQKNAPGEYAAVLFA